MVKAVNNSIVKPIKKSVKNNSAPTTTCYRSDKKPKATRGPRKQKNILNSPEHLASTMTNPSSSDSCKRSHVNMAEQYSNGRRVQHYQHVGLPLPAPVSSGIATRKPLVSRRMEMSVDVEELQMFDGIAACANHTVNFKIGK
jgi:hypothetical protein